MPSFERWLAVLIERPYLECLAWFHGNLSPFPYMLPLLQWPHDKQHLYLRKTES